jgi:hypothetical protein
MKVTKDAQATVTTVWLDLEDAPTVEDRYSRISRIFQPHRMTIRYVEGEAPDIMVSGRVVKKDGSLGEVRVGRMYSRLYGHKDMPDWIADIIKEYRP